jgi:hypothetical protein
MLLLYLFLFLTILGVFCKLEVKFKDLISFRLSTFFFFDGIGILTQGFLLPKQALYCWSHAFSPFCFGCFGDGVSRTVCLGWP